MRLKEDHTVLEKTRVHGSITRTRLLEKLGWDRPVKMTKFMRREGNTRLLGVTKKLVEAGLIDKIPNTESCMSMSQKRQNW